MIAVSRRAKQKELMTGDPSIRPHQRGDSRCPSCGRAAGDDVAKRARRPIYNTLARQGHAASWRMISDLPGLGEAAISEAVADIAGQRSPGVAGAAKEQAAALPERLYCPHVSIKASPKLSVHPPRSGRATKADEAQEGEQSPT